MSAPGHPGEKHQQVTPAYEPKEVTMNATFGSSLLEPKCGTTARVTAAAPEDTAGAPPTPGG